MKILQINKFPSPKGGTETVLFGTIGLLKNAGHEVVLYSTNEGEIIYDPTYTTEYPSRESSTLDKAKRLRSFFFNKKAALQLEDIIKIEKPDIAHIHLYLNGLSSSILPVLKRHSIPIVMTLHEYRQICPSYLLYNKKGKVCEKCKKRNYFNCLFTQCAKGGFIENALLTAEMFYRRTFFKTEKYVDQFIAVSNFVYNKHKEFNPAIAKKTSVIYNPVNTELTTEKKRGNYLLYMGRLSNEKGITTLVDAMKNIPDIQLKVAGSGKIEKLQGISNIEILGFKSNTELQYLISNAMYVVVPSECYETFSMACAESMALGTPVIASNIGALPELVQDAKNGFLFKTKDAANLTETIRKAIRLSDNDYYQLSRKAKTSVAKFDELEYLSSILKLYTQLIRK